MRNECSLGLDTSDSSGFYTELGFLVLKVRRKMNRPTLEDQIRISKMTDDELVDLLIHPKGWEGVDFWLHRNLKLFWRIIHWNWFDIWGKE